MHSIKNILERNKINTQSRADAFIKRKRLISKSDNNLKSGCKYIFKKNQKKPIKPTGLGKKTGFFPTLKKTQKNPLGWV
jgi:hypothetical protein